MSNRNTIILDGTPDAPVLLLKRESSAAASDLIAVFLRLSLDDSPPSPEILVADCNGRSWQLSMLAGEPSVTIDAERCEVLLQLEPPQWASALKECQHYTFTPGTHVWLDETTNLSILLTPDGRW